MGSPSTDGNSERKLSYGQRLLPQVLDELSRSTPDRCHASYPHSLGMSQGFRNVTFQDMACAVDAFDWWINNQLGHSKRFETLLYMGILDLRTVIIFLAAVKCGYKFSGPINVFTLADLYTSYFCCLKGMLYVPKYYY